MKTHLAGIALLIFIGLMSGIPVWAAEGRPADLAARLAREFEVQMTLAKKDQHFGIALGKAGETWCEAALDLAKELEAQQAQAFLEQARTNYQLGLARSHDQAHVQLVSLNFLYQGLSALAFVLAESNKDSAALGKIRAAEKRIMAVVKEAGSRKPALAALAALSGGVLTMLAATARQVDLEGQMAETLSIEFARRREVDLNISRLKDTEPERRILLLTNNHLHGALSMVQIIGLVRNPVLVKDLKRIEEKLLKVKDQGLESQILAGAKALAEAGFLVGPTLKGLKPAPSAAAPYIKNRRDNDGISRKTEKQPGH